MIKKYDDFINESIGSTFTLEQQETIKNFAKDLEKVSSYKINTETDSSKFEIKMNKYSNLYEYVYSCYISNRILYLRNYKRRTSGSLRGVISNFHEESPESLEDALGIIAKNTVKQYGFKRIK